MKDLIVESDILVDFLNGDEGARGVLRAAADDGVMLLCAVSAAQVMAAADSDRREPTARLLESFGIVPVEKEVALLAGEYRADDGRADVELGDCIVAAMAGKLGSVLLTKGLREYPPGEYQTRVVSY